MKVVQHIPTFVEGATAKVAEVFTLEELLAVPWIARWNDEKLSRFSLAQRELMAEMKDGKWWVIAHIVGDATALGLPQWGNT